jgi:dihydroorotase
MTAASAAPSELVITRPDDWHLHVRDGAGLRSVVPHTAKHYGRAIIMPNLVPPVTTAAQVRNAGLVARAHIFIYSYASRQHHSLG